jgi:hypothetical protein
MAEAPGGRFVGKVRITGDHDPKDRVTDPTLEPAADQGTLVDRLKTFSDYLRRHSGFDEQFVSDRCALLDEAAGAIPSPASEMVGLVTDLAQLYEDREIAQWLRSPQTLLRGHTPLALIEFGHIERVRQVVRQVLDGAYI